MEFATKEDAVVKHYTARTIYAVIEENGLFQSDQLRMGYARFDSNIGPMIPHVHTEEGMYVIDCAKAYARFGDSKDTLGERVPIKPGMIMWAAKDEWHVFEFEDGGFVDIVFCLPGQGFVRPD